jgi:hypothetical protein
VFDTPSSAGILEAVRSNNLNLWNCEDVVTKVSAAGIWGSGGNPGSLSEMDWCSEAQRELTVKIAKLPHLGAFANVALFRPAFFGKRDAIRLFAGSCLK